MILMVMAGLAAGGVLKAVLEMRKQSKEHKKNIEKLKKFEQQHPVK